MDALSSPPPNLRLISLAGKLEKVPRWFCSLKSLTTSREQRVSCMALQNRTQHAEPALQKAVAGNRDGRFGGNRRSTGGQPHAGGNTGVRVPALDSFPELP